MEQPQEIAEFRETIRPRDCQIFFGALSPEKLSIFERFVARAVKAPEGDFRDWERVQTWAEDIAHALTPDFVAPNLVKS